MGLFKKLFGKRSSPDITEEKASVKSSGQEPESDQTAAHPADPPANRSGTYDDGILSEKFAGTASVAGERNREICDRFVAKGIIEYSNNVFDEKSLEELSFDELCHVYNTAGWYAKNVMSGITGQVVSYKKFLRKNILSRLSSFPVYTICNKLSNLPFLLQDGSMLLYTDRDAAFSEIRQSGIEWIEVFEIKPADFEYRFCEYICTVNTTVSINGKTAVKIEDICSAGPKDSLGNICVESCGRMVDFNQTKATLIERARKEHRDLNESDMRILNNQSWGVSQSLLKNTLLVPAEEKDGSLKSFYFPTVLFPDGSKYLGIFTDRWAVNRYFRKEVPCVCLPDLIRDCYASFASDTSVLGILINPGREEYKMTREMLKQLFHG